MRLIMALLITGVFIAPSLSHAGVTKQMTGIASTKDQVGTYHLDKDGKVEQTDEEKENTKKAFKNSPPGLPSPQGGTLDEGCCDNQKKDWSGGLSDITTKKRGQPVEHKVRVKFDKKNCGGEDCKKAEVTAMSSSDSCFNHTASFQDE